MTSVDVSIVVCTYNRAELLHDALDSLMALHTDGKFEFEIVVVDNASTDHTSQVIQSVAKHAAVPFRGVCETRPGVACARNCGVREAAGSWIAFFDDDQIADPTWLLELLAAAKGNAARCVGGAVHLLLPDATLRDLPSVCRRLLGESMPVDRPQPFDRKVSSGTGNLLVHKSVFDEIGYFDESLTEAGEDSDITARMSAAGVKSWFQPSAVVRHVVPDHRLKDDYFRWTSHRNGMHIARRDWSRWGPQGFPILFLGRMGQVAVRFLPRWLWGHALHSQRICLEGKCLLWRAEGYFRLVLSWLTPQRGSQDTFMRKTHFRTEREQFADS